MTNPESIFYREMKERITALEKERDELIEQLNPFLLGKEHGWHPPEEIAALKKELDQLRAACAAKDEALRFAHENWSDCFHDSASSCKLCKALSPTAGSDYVKREDLRQTVDLLDRMQVTGKVNHEKLQAELLRLESLLNPKGTDQ